MSTLIVEELYSGIEFNQPVTIDKDINVAHIRPWIYKHGTLVDGDFQVDVLDGATIIASTGFSFTDINAAITNTYAHGFLRFDFSSLILRVPEGSASKEYTFRFSMQNHTTDLNNFLGISRRWEAKVYGTYGDGVVDNEAPNDMVEPAGLEIFEYKVI